MISREGTSVGGDPRSDGLESQGGSQEDTSSGGVGTIEGAEGSGGRLGGGKECEEDSGRAKKERDSAAAVEVELEEERGW